MVRGRPATASPSRSRRASSMSRGPPGDDRRDPLRPGQPVRGDPERRGAMTSSATNASTEQDGARA